VVPSYLGDIRAGKEFIVHPCVENFTVLKIKNNYVLVG